MKGDEKMKLFKKSKERKNLKKLQLATIYDISNILSNENLENLSASIVGYSITKVKNPYQIRRVKAHDKPSVFVKTVSKVDPTSKITMVNVINQFFTEGIDKDKSVFEITIQVKCMAKLHNKQQEKILVNICNKITNSLLESNNVSAISKFDLKVDELHNLEEVSYHKVNVDISEYTNDEEYVPIEVDDISQKLGIRNIEIKK